MAGDLVPGLWQALYRLRDALRAVMLTVAEDRPPGTAPQPVVQLEEELREALGTVHEAIDAVSRAGGDPAGGFAPAAAAVVRLGREWADRTVSPWAMASLSVATAERGPEWSAWRRGVVEGLQGCHEPLWDVVEALLGRAPWPAAGDMGGPRTASPLVDGMEERTP